MLKTKEEIEKEFDFNFCDELGFCNDTKQRDLLEYIHQIRQDDLEEVKKIIKEEVEKYEPAYESEDEAIVSFGKQLLSYLSPNKENKKYLIIEQGDCDDYRVSFIDITDSKLTEKELLTLLKIDQSDKPSIGGRINGELILDGSFSLKDIKIEAEDNINRLFCCYRNRKFKTVLDKFYSKEECLEIAMANDGSGSDYWNSKIDSKYADYSKAYPIYQKLIN